MLKKLIQTRLKIHEAPYGSLQCLHAEHSFHCIHGMSNEAVTGSHSEQCITTSDLYTQASLISKTRICQCGCVSQLRSIEFISN
jgi:hypothetical protein